MAEYKIFFRRSAKKDLEYIPEKDLKRILNRIESLAYNPRPEGYEKLAGDNNLYRIRQGNYRIVYSIQDKEFTVWIVKIGHRREVYRKIH